MEKPQFGRRPDPCDGGAPAVTPELTLPPVPTTPPEPSPLLAVASAAGGGFEVEVHPPTSTARTNRLRFVMMCLPLAGLSLGVYHQRAT